MDTNRNTERLFEKIRQMPEEMSHEKVQQFVLAQAAIGITPVTSKGFAGMHKLFYKFHLNTIAVMTTAATASIISVFVLAANFHKTSENINRHPLFENKNHIVQNTFFHGFTFSADTPKTETKKSSSTVTITNGDNISITTIKTGKGTTNISITTTNDSVITKVSSPDKDSSYSYAYSNSGNAGATVLVFNNGNSVVASTDDISKNLDDLSENLEDLSIQLSDNTVSVCSGKGGCTGKGKCTSSCSSFSDNDDSSDSLVSKIEDALINDKLITDRKEYTFSINGKSVKVNGKKLDDAAWEKYKTIIETNTHSTVNRKFEFSLYKEGDDMTINVKNFEN